MSHVFVKLLQAKTSGKELLVTKVGGKNVLLKLGHSFLGLVELLEVLLGLGRVRLTTLLRVRKLIL